MEGIFPWFYWLFPIAFVIHNAEEAMLFPKWSQSAGRYHRPVGRAEFGFAVMVLNALGFFITAGFYVAPNGSFFRYFFFVFNLAMLINVFFPHLVVTVAMRRYMPGLGTGLGLLLPVTLVILIHGERRGAITFPRLVLYAVPLTAVVVGSIPLLFKLGRRLDSAL